MNIYDEFLTKCKELGLAETEDRNNFRLPHQDLYFVYYSHGPQLQIIGYLGTKAINLFVLLDKFFQFTDEDMTKLHDAYLGSYQTVSELQDAVHEEAMLFQTEVLDFFRSDESN